LTFLENMTQQNKQIGHLPWLNTTPSAHPIDPCSFELTFNLKSLSKQAQTLA